MKNRREGGGLKEELRKRQFTVVTSTAGVSKFSG
jgi:hypothetical protein